MSEANARQVGGSHYAGEYQHWDYVEDIQLGYLEAQATRYMRWRKKNGLEDLEKAVHYLDKLMERKRKNRALYRPDLLEKFLKSGNYDSTEATIITSIVTWSVHYDIVNARALIMELIRRNFHEDGTPKGDSNRHGVSASANKA